MPEIKGIEFCSGCKPTDCHDDYRAYVKAQQIEAGCLNRNRPVVPDQPVQFAWRIPEPMTRVPVPETRRALGQV